MSLIEQLSSLIRELRDENAFVTSEKKHLIELHLQVLKKAEQLFRKTWIISNQRIILDDLIYSTKNRLSLRQYCTKYSNLTNKTQFLESYKLLNYHEHRINEFLKSLRDNPKYLALYLVKSEKLNDTNKQIIPILFSSLYANCLFASDEILIIKLLKNLIDLQFSDCLNVDLRRLIRKTNCSFNILFKYYTGFVFSTRLFLTASLHEPIIHILMQDEWFYDVDPEKTIIRFTNEERLKRFGDPNSPDYQLKVQQHREVIVNKLYTFTMLFIDNISSNLFCFPTSLGYLVSYLYNLVNKTLKQSANNQQQQHDARRLCCDLIMALYICPAICDPESYGVISDIPISPIARHNLMQIANILQVLAMSDDKDPKTQDLYSKFRNNCVSDMLNQIINTNDNFSPFINANQSNICQSNSNTLLRTTLMITQQDLNKIILFLNQISKDLDKDSDEYKWLRSIIPLDYLNTIQTSEASIATSVTSSPKEVKTNLTTTTNNKKKGQLDETISQQNQEFVNESIKVLIININDKGFDCPGMLSEDKVLQEYEANSIIRNNIEYIDDNQSSRRGGGDGVSCVGGDTDICDGNSSVGCNLDTVENCSNENILNINQDNQSLSSSNDDVIGINQNDNDEELIKVGQEANDGLESEFNFSGRDTPIISGRDTPSSHSHGCGLDDINQSSHMRRNSSNGNLNVNNSNINVIQTNGGISMGMNGNSMGGANNSMMMMMNAQRGPNLPITVQKENREDINEKFCKFEINKTNTPLKEEQLSEAWSLDVDTESVYPESVINDQLNEDQAATLRNLNSNFDNLNRQNDTDGYSESASSILEERYYGNNSNNELEQQISESSPQRQQVSMRIGNNDVIYVKSNENSTDNAISKNMSLFLQPQAKQDTQNKKKKFGIFNRLTTKPTTNAQLSAINNVDEATTPDNTADNILKKYDLKNVIKNSDIKPLIQLAEQTNEENSQQQQQQYMQQRNNNNSEFYDSVNFEQCKAFQDAKKKLRLVLSTSISLTDMFKVNSNIRLKENFLLLYLKTQLYEAISLQDMEKQSNLDETIRCMQSFTEQECLKLIKSLKYDYKKRFYYLAYLTKSKKNLLNAQCLIDKLIQRIDCQEKLISYHFTIKITSEYLSVVEQQTQNFTQKFRNFETIDEKFDLFKKYCKQLCLDFDKLWFDCKQDEIDYAHLCIERLLMSRVYTYAMYPNGEIDHFRDRKVFECLQNLSTIVTPNHQLILIPPIYHYESPWNSAQVELKRINAYKTPQDKLNCIKKCMDTIQNLLALAKSPVCADDIQPVLCFVIIKANPPTFLSTVQYIEAFYGTQLEQEYYWTQFMFAFSYIKSTMIRSA